MKWTDEVLQEEALKYKTRRAFREDGYNAWKAAGIRGVLEKITSHMSKVRDTKWNKETLHLEALKYKTRFEFEKADSSTYRSALYHGWMDEICGHMTSRMTKWTDEMIREEALKYNTRADFVRGCRGARDAAGRRGILDEVCSHMVKKYGDKSLYIGRKTHLYLVDVKGSGVKVGLSQKTPTKRFSHDVSRGIDVQILDSIVFQEGLDAWELEQEILFNTEKYQVYKFNHPDAPLKTGNTEIRDYCVKENLIEIFENIRKTIENGEENE